MPEPENIDSSTNPTAPEAPAATAAATEQVGPETAPVITEQLEAAKAEAAANHDKFLRTAADLENYRRRMVREKDELRTAATGRVLEDIFPVMDTLALAIAAAKQPNA